MAEEKAPTLPDLLWGLARTILRREALMTLVSVAVLVAAGGGGVIFAQTRGREAIDAGVSEQLAPVKAEQSRFAEELRGVKSEVQALKAQQAAVEQRNADRFDVLYRTILTGQPSRKAEELSRPVVGGDGGR